ncbi:hypothetical protein AB5I83_19055 [Mesobacillus sp. LC4]
MNRRKIFGIVSSSILVTSILLNPYSIQWDGKKETSVSASTFNRDIFVGSETKFDTLISDINKDKFEDQKVTKKVLDTGKIKLKNGKAKDVSLEGYEDLVFNVEDVRKDKSLQASLGKAIRKGAKVYIFGDLSIPEYADLLGLDKITVTKKDKDGNDMTFRFDETEEEAQKIKGPRKNKPGAMDFKGDYIYDMVGFTLNESEHNQLVVTNINSFDEDGTLIKTSEEEVLADVLLTTAQTIDVEEQKYAAANSSKIFGLLTPISAKADSVNVKSAPYKFYGYAYYAGVGVGKTVSDWILQQGKGETDPSFDYFNVLDNIQIDSYSGWHAKRMWINHDIPYDRDYIWDWDPGDVSSGSYSVAAGAPFNINLGYTFSTDPNVDDIGSKDYDYGRWNVTDYNMDMERFEPGTFWRSRQSDRYARMNITQRGYFTRIQAEPLPPTVNGEIHIIVSYYY